MIQLTPCQLKEISAGDFLPIITNIPYQGERTFTAGFWNGASATAPSLGYLVGAFASFVLYPLDLLGYVDINSHLPPKS